MRVSPELIEAASIYSNPQTLIVTATGGIALLTTVTKGFTVVHKSEMGIKTFRGDAVLQRDARRDVKRRIKQDTGKSLRRHKKHERQMLKEQYVEKLRKENPDRGYYKVVGPGFYPLIPVMQRVVTVGIADRSIRSLEPIKFKTEDGVHRQTHPAFTCAVMPDKDYPYFARFKLNNEKDNKDPNKDKELEQMTLRICEEGLSLVLANMSNKAIDNYKPDQVTNKTRRKVARDLGEYGMCFKAARMSGLPHTDAQVVGDKFAGNVADPMNATASKVVETAAVMAEIEQNQIVDTPRLAAVPDMPPDQSA